MHLPTRQDGVENLDKVYKQCLLTRSHSFFQKCVLSQQLDQAQAHSQYI